MAHNILCKNCGYCESAHVTNEEDHELLTGKQYTLTQCKNLKGLGYSSEDVELEDRLQKQAQKQAYEEKMRAFRSGIN